MSNISKVIIIAGPTAVGKTALAIELARRIGAEIISADSRQCYRELSIGVARPSEEELNQVPHHFIASHSLTDQVNAALFEKEALEITRQLLLKDTRVVITGGTGLYIKAFMNGLDPIPVVPDEIRQSLQAAYEANGLTWLQDQIQRLDPTFWETAEQQNPRRLQRALEVIHATGNSILHFRQSSKTERPFQMLPVCLTLPTPILRERIDSRIAIMMNDGWLEEVRQLLPYRHLPALQTVGYRELIEHLDGRTTLEEATNKISINTWQYARRQMTWWKKQKEFAFLPATEHSLNFLLEQCCS
ncbi:MAG: tRNA (adenosine(37)-N6)-dimethylallyltransferase MiaA [Sediminibacterium sp.]